MPELDANPSARDLAHSLAPVLEAVTNLHYLIDLSVDDPVRLREFRELEDEVCRKMIALVRSHL